MVKLQNIFHEYERSIQKARSRHGYLADKVSQLEMERVEVRTSLEEIKDVKSDLERNQLELQTEVTNLKWELLWFVYFVDLIHLVILFVDLQILSATCYRFQLKQEQENRRNSTMMYNTTRDKLRRTEEQHQLEVQERQKVELTLRNLELEMRTLVNNMKQVLFKLFFFFNWFCHAVSIVLMFANIILVIIMTIRKSVMFPFKLKFKAK